MPQSLLLLTRFYSDRLKTSQRSIFSEIAHCLTLFDPASGKTLWPGGGHYGPPLFFQLWGYQKPKTEPLHIFGTKNNLKSHFGQF